MTYRVQRVKRSGDLTDPVDVTDAGSPEGAIAASGLRGKTASKFIVKVLTGQRGRPRTVELTA